VTLRSPSATKRGRKIDRLRHLLRQLYRAIRPPFAEARSRALLLALEDIEQAIAGSEAADDKKDAVAARARGDKAAPIASRFPPICRARM
jgi:hypothetical protein